MCWTSPLIMGLYNFLPTQSLVESSVQKWFLNSVLKRKVFSVLLQVYFNEAVNFPEGIRKLAFAIRHTDA